MRLLVFGKTGQVARELQRIAPDAVFLGRDAADLARPQDLPAILRDHAPDAVINAAAWTAVDRAEAEEDAATLINATAPGVIAQTCASLGAALVHISTDYVFDGAGTRPFTPQDRPAPLGAYGRSKLAGERAVQAAGGVQAILRTSWVFSAHGSNFVRTMRHLGAERDSLRVVADQIGGPTPAADIARACLTIAGALRRDPALGGVYHYTGAPDISWAGFAREIMARAGLACRIDDIPSSDYPTPAPRPLNSRLDCTGTHAALGLPRPDWRAGLDRVLAELQG